MRTPDDESEIKLSCTEWTSASYLSQYSDGKCAKQYPVHLHDTVLIEAFALCQKFRNYSAFM